MIIALPPPLPSIALRDHSILFQRIGRGPVLTPFHRINRFIENYDRSFIFVTTRVVSFYFALQNEDRGVKTGG